MMYGVSRFERRLFCDTSLDRDIWNYIDIRRDDAFDYITECHVPDDYVECKRLKSNGACLAMKDDELYIIIEDSVMKLWKKEYELVNKVFDDPTTKVFKYDYYPTYVFNASEEYYLKYDEMEEMCPLYKFDDMR